MLAFTIHACLEKGAKTHGMEFLVCMRGAAYHRPLASYVIVLGIKRRNDLDIYLIQNTKVLRHLSPPVMLCEWFAHNCRELPS